MCPGKASLGTQAAGLGYLGLWGLNVTSRTTSLAKRDFRLLAAVTCWCLPVWCRLFTALLTSHIVVELESKQAFFLKFKSSCFLLSCHSFCSATGIIRLPNPRAQNEDTSSVSRSPWRVSHMTSHMHAIMLLCQDLGIFVTPLSHNESLFSSAGK